MTATSQSLGIMIREARKAPSVVASSAWLTRSTPPNPPSTGSRWVSKNVSLNMIERLAARLRCR